MYGFTACCTLMDVGAFEPMIFTTVLTNVGDGYNPKTGIFTPPVAGLYEFSTSHMDYHDSRPTNFVIYVSDRLVCITYIADPTNSDPLAGSCTTVGQVSTTDSVYVIMSSSTDAMPYEDKSFFSGHLIQAYE